MNPIEDEGMNTYTPFSDLFSIYYPKHFWEIGNFHQCFINLCFKFV